MCHVVLSIHKFTNMSKYGVDKVFNGCDTINGGYINTSGPALANLCTMARQTWDVMEGRRPGVGHTVRPLVHAVTCILFTQLVRSVSLN